MSKNRALEYHTLIFFLKEPSEITVYTVFSLVTDKPSIASTSAPGYYTVIPSRLKCVRQHKKRPEEVPIFHTIASGSLVSLLYSLKIIYPEAFQI